MSRRTPHEVLAILNPLLESLTSTEVVHPSDPTYTSHASPYASQKDLQATLALAPADTSELSKVIAFLYKTDLEFEIRGHGFLSPSARDVIVSMKRFDSFEYDPINKLATIGVCMTWADVAREMESVDPEYSVAIARTPSIGVGGTLITGGLSWMSHEFGFISDPINFIDAEVVKYDGTVVMASQEPELMWALRGGGGGFGVMTKVIMRAHYYPTKIWSGLIVVPRKELQQLAADIDEFVETVPHQKISFFLFLAPKVILPAILESKETFDEDMVVIHAYDALGEAHGRKAFHWALSKPGALDQTRVVNMRGVADQQRNADIHRGQMKVLYAPMGSTHLNKSDIIKAIDWYDSIERTDKMIHDCSVVIFEGLISRPVLGSNSQVAWPRPNDFKHLILVIAQVPRHVPAEQEQRLQQVVIDAPAAILGDQAAQAIVNPAGKEVYHDPRKVFGTHYDRLVQARQLYDPNHRFKGMVGFN